MAFLKGMTMKKKLLISSVAVVILVVARLFFFGSSNNPDENALPVVKVQRGNIVEKALAVGTIEPENEISIKSKVSGVVKHIFADVGTHVQAGEPLLDRDDADDHGSHIGRGPLSCISFRRGFAVR